MNWRFVVLLLTLFPMTLGADDRSVALARNSLDNLLLTSSELSKEAQRDGEILRLLREASRSLDDWQKNNAVSKALDNISKAEQLVRQPPVANPRVRLAVMAARQIVAPAKESAMSVDLAKLRGALQARPIEQMREVVAGEISVLARLATQVSDVSGILTKAVAAASATTLGAKGE
jgi:hypothetical protein